MSHEKVSVASKHSLVLAGTFTTGLAVGIFVTIAFQNFVPRTEYSSQDVTQGEIQKASKKDNDSRSSEDSIDVGQFQEFFKRRSLSKQYIALHSTLSQSTEEQLIDWWNQSKTIRHVSHRRMAQSAILQNLTTLNPREALRITETVSIFETDTLLKSVFSQWSVLHLDDAIDGATTLSTSRRTIALQAILEARDDLTEHERRAIATRLEQEQQYLKFASDLIVSHSIVEPRKSWDFLLKDDADDSIQVESLTRIAEAWFEQIGFNVLSYIYDEFDDRGSTQSLIRRQLVRNIAQMDSNRALNYARSLPDAHKQNYLSRVIVFEWALVDPQAALVAVSKLKPVSFAMELQKQIAETWGNTNPNEVIKKIETVSEEVRPLVLESTLTHIARKNPLHAIAQLSSVGRYVEDTTPILKSVLRQWSLQEPSAAADWVVSNYADQDPQRRTLLAAVLPDLSRRDPSQAFELAVEQSTSVDDLGLERIVIRVLAQQGDIQLAKKLLPRVKENTRLYTHLDVGSALMRASRTDEALKLGKDFEGDDHRTYYHSVLYDWANTNPKKLYDKLEDLPSGSVQSIAAVQLITVNRFYPVFSEDQIKHARTFLILDDAIKLDKSEYRW